MMEKSKNKIKYMAPNKMQDMQSSLGLSLPTGLEENVDGRHWYFITRGHSDLSANKTT